MVRHLLAASALNASLALAVIAQPAQPIQQPSDGQPAQPGQNDRRNRDGGGRGGQQMNAERSAAAWRLQAESVAKRFDLDPTSTTTLVEAYSAARKENQAEVDKAREDMRQAMEGEGGGDRRESMRKMMVKQDEIQTASRASLKKAISSVLKGEQLDNAMKSLGSFNRQWDQAVDAVAFMNLDAIKQQRALEAVEDYTLAQTEIGNKMRAMFEIGDMSGGQKLREDMDKARQACVDAVKPLLSQEQAIKFEESLPRGMGGMRGFGGFGGGPGGGGGPRGGN